MFKTSRLLVRRWLFSDLESIYSIYSDSELMKWVGDSQPLNLEQCKNWIDITLSNYENKGFGMYLIEELHSKEIIGCVGLINSDRNYAVEAKYVIKKEFSGKGFATEILGGVIKYALNSLGFYSVVVTIDPENIASRRVATKCGMKFIAQMDDTYSTIIYEYSAT